MFYLLRYRSYKLGVRSEELGVKNYPPYPSHLPHSAHRTKFGRD